MSFIHSYLYHHRIGGAAHPNFDIPEDKDEDEEEEGAVTTTARSTHRGGGDDESADFSFRFNNNNANNCCYDDEEDDDDLDGYRRQTDELLPLTSFSTGCLTARPADKDDEGGDGGAGDSLIRDAVQQFRLRRNDVSEAMIGIPHYKPLDVNIV